MIEQEAINESALLLLAGLTTPIKGQPSMEVLHLENAKRLIVATFKIIYEAGFKDGKDK